MSVIKTEKIRNRIRTSEDLAADLASFPGLEKAKALGFFSGRPLASRVDRQTKDRSNVPPVCCLFFLSFAFR